MARRERLIELRGVAERLALGEYGAMCLRDLIIEIIDELTGVDSKHEAPSLASARAPAPAPELVGVTAGLPSKRLAAPAGSKVDQPSPDADVPDPAGDTWLADLAAADEKAEADAKAAAAAADKTKNDPKKAASPTPNGGH